MYRFLPVALVFIVGVVTGVGVSHVLRSEPPSSVDEIGHESGATLPLAATHTEGAVPPNASMDPSTPTLSGTGVTASETAFLERALAAERVRRREARIRPDDGGLDILRRRLEHEADLTPLLARFESFRESITGSAATPVRLTVSGESRQIERGEIPKTGEVIEFGPGTFHVPDGAFRHLRQRELEVERLVIRGAGMDRTTLVGSKSDFLTVGCRIDNLIVENLTFDATREGAMLLDVYGQASVLVENVRVLGWTSGGHGSAIGISGPSFLACRGCEFLGRHGKSPGGGAISFRDDCVALVEDCVFADIPDQGIRDWNGISPHAGVWLRGCTFENTKVYVGGGRGTKRLAIHVRGATVHLGPADLSSDDRAERWGATAIASAEDVTYHHGIPRCTLDDMAGALAVATIHEGARVMGVEVAGIQRGPPLGLRLLCRGFVVPVLTSEGEARGYRIPNRQGSLASLREKQLQGALSIKALLSRIELPDGIDVRRLVYATHRLPDGSATVPAIRINDRWQPWVFDARDGSLIHRP